MKIYYKIGTYMNKLAAMEACRISAEKNISVLEAALNFGKIPAGTRRSVKSIQTHMQGLLEERAEKAIYRITYFMGYREYLERSHIKESKIQILEALAANETSALRLVERLEELSVLIKEKTYNPDCKFILSTIHSSKGLEYDRVYLMDAKDGIFPEKVIKNRSQASKEELNVYEEERRLYYVGVTRAKNNLCIFTFKDGATFSRELFGQDLEEKNAKSRASLGQKPRTKNAKSERRSAKKNMLSQTVSSQRRQRKRIITEAEYLDKLAEIRITGYVKHKKYGAGRVLSITGDRIEIEFESRTTKCLLKILMEHELIE